MLQFLTAKLSKNSKPEIGSEDASQCERGLGITSNQSEFSEGLLIPPSEVNAELNESADGILLSQLQRENEDLKEVW